MIKLEVSDDYEKITKILTSDEMWPRISEDGQKKEDLVIEPSPVFIWLMIRTDRGKCLGLFYLHYLNLSTIQGHIHIIKEYRARYAGAVGKAMLKWIDKELDSRVNKIIAEIPVIYKDVYHYVKKHGFSDEGLNRQSILKNGKFVDQYRLGITREEIKQCLQQQ